MRIQFDGRWTVRFCPTAISIGFGMVSRLAASRIRMAWSEAFSVV
jgi:hypothetical protein